jgi:hypothetical protein
MRVCEAFECTGCQGCNKRPWRFPFVAWRLVGALSDPLPPPPTSAPTCIRFPCHPGVHPPPHPVKLHPHGTFLSLNVGGGVSVSSGVVVGCASR